MTTHWEKVHVFISSTFNDMHAERDYLVKQVFPQLREWCDKRKLRLVDIDLRWGVTEQDALHNKSVVKVCLDRIDECRPFFLCFLGQRRGWVPGKGDISAATFEEFPGLKEYAGNTSVTEMEILHALMDPLHRDKVRDPKKPAEFYIPAEHAFFYLRDDSYLGRIPTDPPLLRQTYTNEGVEKEEERADHDTQLKYWRDEKIPATGRPSRHYKAEWDSHLTTPELLLPLQCPSSEPTNIQRWKDQWAKAGVTVTGDDTEKDPAQAEKARIFNQKLTAGRLANFHSENQPLSTVILHDLQAAIKERYPDYTEIGEVGDLQKEIDQQEQFLYTGSEGFISRGNDFKELDAYVDGNEKKLFVLTAAGGMGKSTLLANWIDHILGKMDGKTGQSIHFRFIGQSDRSTTVYSLLHFLLQELKEYAHKLAGDIPDDPQKLRQELPKLLEAAGKEGKTIIVLDALNQLESGLSDLTWLPYQLPENIKLVVSFKRGEPAAEEFHQRMQGQAILAEVKPFASLDDRRKLVKAYLAQYLKDLDERHLETLISSDGADNPLFLKVVLSELRVFGAFANLGEKIRLDFGKTPISAFEGVLKRLETDPAYSPIDPKQAVPLLFGLLAHTRQGLSAEELTGLFMHALEMENNEFSRQSASDTVYLYLRQVHPFLSYRSGSYIFFYDSFKLAAQERYEGKESPKRDAQDWHKELAEYFAAQPLKAVKNNRELPYTRKLIEQPYQQAYANLKDEFVKSLSNFEFLEAKTSSISVLELIEDLNLGLQLLEFQTEIKAGLDLIREALLQSAHVLVKNPQQLAGQLIGRFHQLDNPLIKALCDQIDIKKDTPWLRPLTQSINRSGGALHLTIPHAESIDDMALSNHGQRLFTLSGSKTLKTFNMQNGAEIQSLALKRNNARMIFVTENGRKGAYLTFNHFDLARLDLENNLEGDAIKTYEAGAKSSAAISPDQTLAIFGTEKGYIEVWDLKEEKEKIYFRACEGQINSIVITPDNHWAISSENSSDLRVWNLANGTQALTYSGHTFLITALALTKDGKKCISASQDGTLKVWELSTGDEIKTIPGNLTSISGLTVSENGEHMLYLQAGTLHVWELRTWKETPISPQIWGQLVGASSNFEVVVATHFNKAYIWDVKHKEKTTLLVEDTTEITALSVSTNGKFLVYGLRDNTIKIWNLHKRKEAFAQAGKSNSSLDRIILRISSDDKRVLVLFWNFLGGRKTVKVLDIGDGKELADTTFEGNTRVFGISTHGDVVVYANFDGVNLLDTAQVLKIGKTIEAKTFTGIRKGMSQVAMNSLGYLYFSSWDAEIQAYSIQMWSAENGQKPIRVAKQTGYSDSIHLLCLSPDGGRLLMGTIKGEILVWDIVNSKELFRLSGHIGRIMYLEISADGRYAFTMADDPDVRVWDLETGNQIQALQIVNSSPDGKVRTTADHIYAISPTGEVAITGSSQTHTLKAYNLLNGKEVQTLKDDKVSFSVGISYPGTAISPDGKQAVIFDSAWGGRSGKGDLWDLVEGKKLLQLEGHSREVTGVLMTPESEFAVSRSSDKTVKVWRLKLGTGGHAAENLDALSVERSVRDLAMNPKSGSVFAASNDAIKAWDYPSLENIFLLKFEDHGGSSHLLYKMFLDLPIPVAIDVFSHWMVDSMGIGVWDLSTGKRLAGTVVRFSKNAPAVLTVAPDGERVVYTEWLEGQKEPNGQFITIWDWKKDEKKSFAGLPQKYENVSADFSDLVVTPDGKTIIAMDHMGLIHVCDMDEARIRYSINDEKQGGYTTPMIKVSLDGRMAMANKGYSTAELRVWDIASGEDIKTLKLDMLEEFVLFSPDGKMILTRNANKMKLFDLDNSEELLAITGKNLFLYEGKVNRTHAFSPDGSKMAFGFGENALNLGVLSLNQRKIIVAFNGESPITKCVFLQDGKTIAVGDSFGKIHFYRLEGMD